MSEDRGPLVLAGLALALAALLAFTSPGLDWESGDGSGTSDRTAEEPAGQEPREDVPADRESRQLPDPDEEPSGWRLTLTGVFTLLALLAATVFAVALLTRLRLTLRRRRFSARLGLRAPPRMPDEDADTDSGGLLAAVDAGLDVLELGTPRNAVVAAWVGLESAAEAAGLERDPADTAAELGVRMLAAYPVDRASLDQLADLYREARFSRHELTEGHRSQARACLERLRGDLVPGAWR